MRSCSASSKASPISPMTTRVDACSGALEMLNPEGGSWAIFEIYREQAEQLDVKKQPCQPAEPNWAPGSVEWQAAQDKKNRSS